MRKRNRVQLKAAGVKELISKNASLALEHGRLEDLGYGLPRVTVITARSGKATIRATWRKRIQNGSVSARMVQRGVELP